MSRQPSAPRRLNRIVDLIRAEQAHEEVADLLMIAAATPATITGYVDPDRAMLLADACSRLMAIADGKASAVHAAGTWFLQELKDETVATQLGYFVLQVSDEGPRSSRLDALLSICHSIWPQTYQGPAVSVTEWEGFEEVDAA